MEFFDKLGQKASEAYKATADKTGKIAKEAKLKMKISDLKSQINSIYKEIGEVVYQKHVKELCTKIDVLSDEIDSNLKQCLELNDKKQCQNCYKEIEKDTKFCPECGTKQEETKENDNKEEQAKEVEVIENNDEKTNLEKTTEVEISPKLEENETVEEIKYEEE